MFNNVEEFRTYVLHMISEHRRLNAAVQTIEQRWHAVSVEAASEDTVADLISSLKQLHDELHHHFTDEEGGGCIEEAVAHCPSLRDDAARVEQQHGSLLEQLSQIIQHLGQAGVDLGGADVAHSQFHDFVQRLQNHESAEDEILERGFGTVE